jgi:type IV secretion system protein TrbL
LGHHSTWRYTATHKIILFQMEPGVLTTTLGHFLQAFSHGWGNLQPAINFLIKVFLGIEIVMFGLWMALGGIDNLVGIMKKLLYLLVWAWIIKKYPELTDAFVRSLIQAGQMAAGKGNINLFDPSLIITLGFNATDPIVKEMRSLVALLKGPEIMITGFCYIMIILAYIIIAWQIFYTILEFYLIIAIVGLFLPFGFFEPTKFLAEKSIGAIVSAGIKLMVLAFLLAIIEPTLQTLTFDSDTSYTKLFSAILTVGALAFLCWNAPGVAAGLMSGSPNLTAGMALQNAAALGSAVTKAGSVAVNTIKSAISAATKPVEKIPGSGPGGGAGSNAGRRAGKAAGTALQQSSKVAGQAVQKAGEGVSAAGQGMKAAGGKIAATPIPVVSQVAGAVVGAAGVATDLAGKDISVAGRGIEKAGEEAGKAVEKTGEAVGKVADKTADAKGKTLESDVKVANTAPTTPAAQTGQTQASGAPRSNKDNSSDWAKAMLENKPNNPQDA